MAEQKNKNEYFSVKSLFSDMIRFRGSTDSQSVPSVLCFIDNNKNIFVRTDTSPIFCDTANGTHEKSVCLCLKCLPVSSVFTVSPSYLCSA